MRKSPRLTTATLLLLFTPGAFAATLLEAQVGHGGLLQKSWVEGEHARVETAGQDGYVIQDLANARMYMVSPRERMVMDMSGTLKTRSDATVPADARIVDQGAGPKIAGYATERYAVVRGGHTCARYDLAPKLAGNSDLERYARAFSRLQVNTDAVPGMGGDRLCDPAEQALGPQLARHGFPLRMEKSGREEYRVVRIENGVTVPAGFFQVPKQYPVTDMGTLLKGLPKAPAPSGPQTFHDGPRINVKAYQQQLKQLQGLIRQQMQQQR